VVEVKYDQVIGVVTTVLTAMAGGLGVFLLGVLRIKQRGGTMREAATLNERVNFRNEMQALLEAAKLSAKEAQAEVDDVRRRYDELHGKLDEMYGQVWENRRRAEEAKLEASQMRETAHKALLDFQVLQAENVKAKQEVADLKRQLAVVKRRVASHEKQCKNGHKETKFRPRRTR
jgi:uncharacterized coiled-coil DUF342 family protein